jgi:hypothetical protein
VGTTCNPSKSGDVLKTNRNSVFINLPILQGCAGDFEPAVGAEAALQKRETDRTRRRANAHVFSRFRRAPSTDFSTPSHHLQPVEIGRWFENQSPAIAFAIISAGRTALC